MFFAGLPCAMLFAGCRGTTTSDTVPTEEIVAEMNVQDDGSGTVYTDVHLRAKRTNNDIRLSGRDELHATFGDQSAVLADAGSGHYDAAFDLSSFADVTIAFDRDKFEPAPESFGLLPDALDISGFEGLVVSRSFDAIVITLPETTFDKFVDVSGPCVSPLTYNVGTWADDVVIDAGVLYASNPNDECYVTITLTSALAGEVDPALHPDSTFVLTRTRSSSFYSVP